MINDTSPPLGDMSVETFLSEYWQKKPLLIRQAFKNFNSPITGDELAGLACEEEVNSRIVIEKGGEHPWQAIHGPMDESIFAKMSETHWTLVVNDLEKYVPELAWMTDRFRFIPEWHLDDLMSSWAAPEGTVGPHVDLYDVFIVQGEGSRRWQISTQPVAEDNFIPGIALRLQKDFTAEFEWLLEEGDMMYLPAGVSHSGISIGESLSYSIGYRATSHTDLVTDFIAHITDDLSINKTYQIPYNQLQKHPNEISPEAIEEVRRIFKQYLDPEHPELARWFGNYVSDVKVDFLNECEEPLETFSDLLIFVQESETPLIRHPSSRFAFMDSDSVETGEKTLFIDGSDYPVSKNLAYALCDNREVDLQSIAEDCTEQEQQFVLNLYNSGKLYQLYDLD